MATLHQRPFIRTFFLSLLLSLLLVPTSLLSAQNKKSSADFGTLSKQADAARDAERLDDAVALYQKALALSPKWAEGWFSLGTLEYERNDYAAAARAFRAVLPLAPKEGSAHAFLGLCEYELGDYDNALKHINEASALGIAKNPQFRQVVLYHEGLLNLRKSRFEAAREALAQLCREHTSSPDTLKAMGMVALRIPGLPTYAEGSLESHIIPRVGHAACLAAAQKYDEARPEFATLVNEYPAYPNIHYAYGRFLAEINDVPAAVEQYQLEIKNNPEDINSRLEIAASEYKVDSAAGVPYVEDAVRIAPQIAFGHYLLGLLYLDTGAAAKALPQLEVAAKAFPNDAKVFFALSTAYARTGNKEKAAQARARFETLNKQSDANSKATY